MFCRSMSRRMEVRVSVSNLELVDADWYLMSPKAMELRLLMCSMVSCANWVRFCLIWTAVVEGVTLGTSSLTIRSVWKEGYFCFGGPGAFSCGSLFTRRACRCFRSVGKARFIVACLGSLDCRRAIGF